MEPTKDTAAYDISRPDDSSDGNVTIFVDPELEKSALRKFDKWLLPAAFVFLLLSSLDRSNVGVPLEYKSCTIDKAVDRQRPSLRFR